VHLEDLLNLLVLLLLEVKNPVDLSDPVLLEDLLMMNL
tara:strand:- start:210 stop:323 length:114 start_codon:yes stop_codon:yes gene_type:complete